TTPYMYDPSSLWRFDNNSLDSIGNLSGVAVNSPRYVIPGITGSGYALSLTRNNAQYVTIATYQNFSYVSFTLEMWFYLTSLNQSVSGLFSQRDSGTTDHQLILMVYHALIYVSFYSDDVSGATMLSTNTWYHAAFVYDYPSRTQIVYLNGYQDGIHTSAGPYLGMAGAITIGMYIDYTNTLQCFDGYIDQVSLTVRSKTATEILGDATLTTWHSFDSTPYSDTGPLGLNAKAVNITSVSGRVNQAISFTSNSSYYQVNGFVLLGIPDRSFSISLWVNPATTSGSTLVHVSTTTNGQGWCVDLMGFSSTNQIIVTGWSGSGQQVVGPVLPANIWTNVISTYSTTNGVRLYVNGTLIGTTGPMGYGASALVNILTLANPLQAVYSGGGCNSMSIVPSVYLGYLDEFRVYSRELNGTDVHALANP
ncbi:unnamed protein product, partial [Adineta steineri]